MKRIGNYKGRKRIHPLPNIGDRFGRLTVSGNVVQVGHKYTVPCTCDCGVGCTVQFGNLVSGHTKSCGCLFSDSLSERNRIHGGRHTRLYTIWCDIKQRCYNPHQKHFANYGGRGISVCKEWLDDFSKFQEWASSNGYSDILQIDRINNDGDYRPSNCRWVNSRVNNRNRRDNRIVSAFGESKTLIEWSQDARCVVPYKTLHGRIVYLGWASEDAIIRLAI